MAHAMFHDSVMTMRLNRQSWVERFSATLLPTTIAVAGFFGWIMLVNSLRIPYWLYYERTIYLIYLGRSLDPIAWVLSSVFALFLLAKAKRSRRAWLWPGVLLLWSGISLGTFGLAGLGRLIVVVGPLLALVGLVLGANAVFKELALTRRGYFVAAILLVLSALILPVELGSLSYYVLSAFHPANLVGISWELLELQLWYTAFPLVPFLYVAFLFSWIWAPLVAWIIPSSTNRAVNGIAKGTNESEGRAWILAIIGYVVLAAFIGYFAYFHSSNYNLVGTDIYWRNALPAERVLSSTSWLVAAAKERHPLVVLGIASVSRLSGLEVESLLRFAYVGLVLAFGLAIFALVFTASRNKLLACLSALVSAVAVSTTDGMYTGTIAEWIALIVWIMSLTCLAIAGRNLRRQLISTLCLAIGSLAVLFIHPWTWIAMIATLTAYCLIMFIARPKGYLRETSPVLAVVFLNAAGLALSLLVLMKTQGWRVAHAFMIVQESLSSKYFGLGSWEILVFFSQIWSQFLNPVLLGLAILGVIVLARRRDKLSWIVLAWIVAACATNVVAAPRGYNPLDINRGQTQIFRAMFLTPFQIPAAIGLLHLKSALDGRVGQSSSARVVVGLAIALLFLATVNGAFRALFPLLTDPHNYPNPLKP